MGFPHPTIDLPGSWPVIADEIATIRLPDRHSEDLSSLLRNEGEVSVATHVCATAWVLSPDHEHTVLVRHRSLGWCTPGGHIETHENSRDAALRELGEETGLTRFDVTAIDSGPSVVHLTDTLVDGAPHRHFNIGWLFTASMEAPLSVVEGARWHAIADIRAGRLAGDSAPDLAEILTRLV